MKWIGFDFETSSPNKYACDIDCCGIVVMHDFRVVTRKFIENKNPNSFQKAIQKMFDTHDGTPVCHNASFDLHLLKRIGVSLKRPCHDTLLMASHWRNDLPSFSLKNLAWVLLEDVHPPLTKILPYAKKGDGATDFYITDAPLHLKKDYCLYDAYLTALLAENLYPLVEDIEAYQMDIRLLPHLLSTEEHGVMVDIPLLESLEAVLKQDVKQHLAFLRKKFGLDESASPMGTALQKYLASSRYKLSTTKTSKITTAAKHLEQYKKDPVIYAVLEVKRKQKILSTFVENFLQAARGNGKFHPGFRQSAAITRRFTCSSLYSDDGTITKGQTQNIPRDKEIRSVIIVPEGFKLLKLDLASIEARLASHAMAVLLDFDFYAKKYRECKNFNLYMFVIETHTPHGKVDKTSPIYQAYKQAVLGILYGIGESTFANSLIENHRLPYSYEEGVAIYRSVLRECPEFRELQRAFTSINRNQGYIVDDFGAVYFLPIEEEYKGVNYYCQGCAGNILKWWWLAIADLIQKNQAKDYIFNTVHDELDMAVFLDESAKQRASAYENVLSRLDRFSLPIIAEASELVDNWGQA
ncbi:MAG: DNA polymerase [Candidatus Methanomethylicaceae archaeon]